MARHTAVMERAAVGALLDLENLLHLPRHCSGPAVRRAFVDIAGILHRLGALRYAVAACDHWLARMLVPVAEGAGIRVHSGALGPDRADRELLVRVADVPASVGTLVIGSGDGIFAPLAAAQRAAGRRVIVLGPEGGTSRSLAAEADAVLLVPGAGVHRVIDLDAA